MSIIVIIPIFAVVAVFWFLFRKGWLEKWTGYKFPTEDFIEKNVAPSNSNLVFVPKDNSFLIFWIGLIILTAFFFWVFFADSSVNPLLRVIFLIFPLMFAFYIFYMPLAYISKIIISPKSVKFEKFFPFRTININPEFVEKVIVGIVRDISGMNLVNTLIFCLKDGKMYNFIFQYYDAEAIQGVLAQFPKAVKLKKNLSFFKQVYYAIKTRFNLRV